MPYRGPRWWVMYQLEGARLLLLFQRLSKMRGYPVLYPMPQVAESSLGP